MKRSALLVLCAVAAAVLVAGCGSSGSGKLEIVKFSGPSVVGCTGAKGETHIVSYKYETKNATTVEPEIDGQPVGASAGYDPKSGTMRFTYACVGPHTFTITASGKDGKTASKSIDVAPSSSG